MSEEIVRLAARGDGVTASGRHIPLGAPGDRVDIDGSLSPGPHHPPPPCRHFPRCGGCQLQHIDDETYSDFLRQRVTGALAAQGLAIPRIRAPHLSPFRSRRRTSLRAERMGRNVVIGFNEGASHRIVDMRECHVLAPALFALVEPLRVLLRPLLLERRPAELRLTLADQGIDLVLTGVPVAGLAAIEAVAAFARDHALARLSIDDGMGAETRWEPENVTVSFGNVPVGLPPGAFLQATPDGEAVLQAAVMEAVGGATTVADLFAGLGTFTLPLAEAARVLAVEGARDPALALRVAANRARRPVMVEQRDLFRRPLATADLDPFASIVLDPPRAGAREQMPALAAAAAAHLAYVSCNPATFARDARMLMEGGWRLDWIKPVGQFRWSTQIELVAALVRPL